MSVDVIFTCATAAMCFRRSTSSRSQRRFLFTMPPVAHGAQFPTKKWKNAAIHGHTQIVPPGFNERLLAQAGLKLLDSTTVPASLLKNATGRLAAKNVSPHRTGTVGRPGRLPSAEVQYLETVLVALSQGVRYPESCTWRSK